MTTTTPEPAEPADDPLLPDGATKVELDELLRTYEETIRSLHERVAVARAQRREVELHAERLARRVTELDAHVARVQRHIPQDDEGAQTTEPGD